MTLISARLETPSDDSCFLSGCRRASFMTYFVHSDVDRVAARSGRCAEMGWAASCSQGNSVDLHNLGRVP